MAWQGSIQPFTAMDEAWMAIWQRIMLVAIWSALAIWVYELRLSMDLSSIHDAMANVDAFYGL